MVKVHVSSLAFGFLLISLFVVEGLAQNGKRPFTEYASLSERQRELIDGWSGKGAGNGRGKFEAMSPSQHSAFQAITNALARTKLTGKNGKLLGYAIDLVAELEYPAGEEQGKGSDEQFRLYVKLVDGAVDKLEASREFGRSKDNTVFHHGYPINYRQLGKAPTLQFSITPEKLRADIDIDYRSSSFPAALFNGHLTAGNSDVRVGGNYPTHLTRWAGLIDWWDRDVVNVLDSLIGINSKAPEPAYIPVLSDDEFGDSSAIEAASNEFLATWLVRRDPKRAESFISSRLAACLDITDRGAEVVYRQRRRILFFEMMVAANKAIGKVNGVDEAVTSLRPVYRSIVPLDHKRKFSYTLAHVPVSYYQHFVCDGSTENWNASQMDGDRTYGQYFVSMFRFNAKNGMGGGLKLFWVKEASGWKIITFDVVNA